MRRKPIAKKRKTRIVYRIPGILLVISCEEVEGVIQDTGDTTSSYPAKRRKT